MDPTPSLRDELFAVDDRDDGRLEAFAWRHIRTLWSNRLLIAVGTILVAVVSTVVLLLIPNEYRATARVLSPEGGANPITAMLGRNVGSAATALLGGSSGEYARYLTILTSRSLREQVVDRFDLIEVYELEEDKHPREKAVEQLAGRTSFPIDMEFEYLSVSVLDTSPERAADMANYIVELLNERNSELSAQGASSFRRYVEQRYVNVIAEVDSLLSESEEFQREYGVYDMEAQTQAFFTQMGIMGGEIAQREIEYDAMQRQYGAENPRVTAYADAVSAAKRTYDRSLAGGEDLLPVSQAQMPEVVRRYLTLERDLTIKQATLEAVTPMLETARLQEEQRSEALQVVDPAVAPIRKEWPRRSRILIMATISAFALICLLVLLAQTWRQFAPSIWTRLNEQPISRG